MKKSIKSGKDDKEKRLISDKPQQNLRMSGKGRYMQGNHNDRKNDIDIMPFLS